MQSWSKVFSEFKNCSILVIGDVMLDVYIWGHVERISPEAPIPILNVKNRDARLGGAANVALNIHTLGATPILCTLIGQDEFGTQLIAKLKENGMSQDGLVLTNQRRTTTKTRVMAMQQHIVRIDEETNQIATADEEKKLLEKIENLLPQCQAVIFEDYDKGTITQRLIEQTVSWAKTRGIPTIVDPKNRNFYYYQHVTLFKPNLKELCEGLKMDVRVDDATVIRQVIDLLKNRLQADGVLLTLSEQGVYIDYQNEKIFLAAHQQEITDVSGAGDTVVSVIALCIAVQLPPRPLALLANLAGGIVCQHTGVVPIYHNELLQEIMKLDP